VHREKKEGPVYALVVDKKGPKLTRSTAADSTFSTGGGTRGIRMTFQKQTTGYLALQLSNSGGLGREVMDKTGLTGTWDCTLHWVANPLPDSDEPGLFTAVQEQLGLKLEPQRALVDMLIVDHAEKPSAN
jgi:uncharacterized protein (TIGR03435 family)